MSKAQSDAEIKCRKIFDRLRTIVMLEEYSGRLAGTVHAGGRMYHLHACNEGHLYTDITLSVQSDDATNMFTMTLRCNWDANIPVDSIMLDGLPPRYYLHALTASDWDYVDRMLSLLEFTNPDVIITFVRQSILQERVEAVLARLGATASKPIDPR